MKTTTEIAKEWATNPYFNEKFRTEIQDLIDQNLTEEIKERFYQDVKFGTGGMRGIIGAGRNRINQYTIQKATQGYANYILSQNSKNPSVVIAYDSRRKSKIFAEQTSTVFAANKIKVHLFSSLHPTPLASYAVLKLKTTGGVVITASHNPPEYNGYKVYWSNGYQVSTPQDQAIISEVKAIENFSKIRIMPFEEALEKGLIKYIPESLDEEYLNDLEKETYGDTRSHGDFHFIYTPLHGTGRDLVKKLMMRRGFTNFKIVPSQEFPDENFTTVNSPNPENPEAYKEAIEFSNPEDQIILATDPDADRIGVMIRNGENWEKLNGNEIGVLLLDYKLRQLKKGNRLPKNGFIISTVVTSGVFKKLAVHYGLEFYETLTGFKYIGRKIDELVLQNKEFVFACEESHGYQTQTFLREKDGISASLFFAEMAAECQAENISVRDRLNEIYNEHGFHNDFLQNVSLPGASGTEQINNIMQNLRKNPFKKLMGIKVLQIKDYLEQKIIDCVQNTTKKFTEFPVENLLVFYLKDGSRISARPSGTEPLIKYYFNLCGDVDAESLVAKKEHLLNAFNQILLQK